MWGVVDCVSIPQLSQQGVDVPGMDEWAVGYQWRGRELWVADVPTPYHLCQP